MEKTRFILLVLLLCFILPSVFSDDTEEDLNENTEIALSLTDSIPPHLVRKPLFPSNNSIFGFPEELDFKAGMDMGYNKVFWLGLGFRLDYFAGPFKLVAEMSFLNDKKYAANAVLDPDWELGSTVSSDFGGFYFLMNEGGISYDKGPIHLAAGRFRNYDEVDSPYTLFLNSEGISANTLKFRWETNGFIYQTQWIELNRGSATSSPAWNEYNRRKYASEPEDFDPSNYNNMPFNEAYWLVDSGFANYDTKGLASYGFPDRGLNLKLYGLKIKDWRVGLVDAMVYSGRAFDLAYFLIPIPMFFTQIFRTDEGRPWSTQMNDNTLFGLFGDVKKEKWDAYAQVLVDDITTGFLNEILDTDIPRNPWKGAWTIGGRYHTKIGSFGFHHAGALKYTYEPIGVDEEGIFAWDSGRTSYGYTYYPETRYFSGSSEVQLLIQDNMIGYKHGENNIAFQIDYQTKVEKFLMTAELELLLAGNNSPANPWHKYNARRNMINDGKPGTQLLNDGQIEKKLELRYNLSRMIGNKVGAYAAFAVGGRFNRLELKPAEADPLETKVSRTVDDDIWIWKATDNHEFIYRFSIGFRFIFPII